ncbi:hypothetical protein CRENBAI_012235 [Crenichthys baileyi]|uniref:Uncharacterized protein n=1 Tax=Crenichthys baileyi TaxID=28760 RepID=A0AAV9S780_9TELE
METQSQASSAAEKKKRVESIVATKGSSARTDISEKAVASSTTSNAPTLLPPSKQKVIVSICGTPATSLDFLPGLNQAEAHTVCPAVEYSSSPEPEFPHDWLNSGFILGAIHLCGPPSCSSIDSSKKPVGP